MDPAQPQPNGTANCDALGRLLPGHTMGKRHGTLSKRRQTAIELFERLDFDPLEKKVMLCKMIEEKLIGRDFVSDYEKIEYLKLYHETLKDVLQYGYQRLKAVEHLGQIEIVQKLQQLDDYTDEELKALLAEAEDYSKRKLS
jgi:hypothetical protein